MQACAECGTELLPEKLQPDASSAWCAGCLSVFSTRELPQPESIRFSDERREIEIPWRFASHEIPAVVGIVLFTMAVISIAPLKWDGENVAYAAFFGGLAAIGSIGTVWAMVYAITTTRIVVEASRLTVESRPWRLGRRSLDLGTVSSIRPERVAQYVKKGKYTPNMREVSPAYKIVANKSMGQSEILVTRMHPDSDALWISRKLEEWS